MRGLAGTQHGIAPEEIIATKYMNDKFQEMPKAKRRQIRELPIKEIWFESIGARG
jgi:hypothetical protein